MNSFSPTLPLSPVQIPAGIDFGPDAKEVTPEKLGDAGLLGDQYNANAKVFMQLLPLLQEKLDIKDLCDALPRHRQNFGLLDILNSMANLNYEVRNFSARPSFVDPRLFPVLFVPDKHDTTMLLFADKNGQPCIFDGTQTLPLTQDRRNDWSGKIYVFSKSEKPLDSRITLERQASGKSWFRIIFKRLQPIIRYIAMTSFCINIVTLSVPLLMMLVYDKVIGSQSLGTLPAMGIGFAAMIIAEGMLRYLRATQFSWLGTRLDAMVGNEIFRHLLLLPPQLIERAPVASQLVRIKGFEAIRDFFSGSIFLSLMDLPYVVLLLTAIGFIGGDLVLIGLGAFGFYLLLLWYFYDTLKISAFHAAKTNSNRQQATLEAFNKAEALRYTGLVDHWHKRFHEISGKTAYAAFDYAQKYAIIETLAYSLYVLAGVATLYMGVEKVIAGQITAGGLIAVMILTWRALSPVSTLCTSLPRIEQLRNIIGQINRLMSMTLEKDDGATGKITHKLKGEVEFSYVGLRYSKNADPVFAGLSFKVLPGQTMAITGSNGTGKSTILKLVNALYRPQAGNIRIDGIDIRQIEPHQLHRHIAYVSQQPEFFRGTIADNLRLVAPLAERERLLQMLELVDAGMDIAALPQGIDTHISGPALSHMTGSFAYKLNLARALLRDAPILLLDELPSGLLNGPSGPKIHKLVQAYRGQKTILLITHREDFIRTADVALGLRSGKLPLSGRPDQVLNQLQESGDNL